MIPTGGGPSPSAEMVRRSSEKAQIQDIKERFSNYIRNVKSIRNQLKQGDNTSAVQHLQDELITIRTLYEKEIGELREKLEQSYRDGSRDGLGGRTTNLMAAEYQSRLLEMSRDILKKDEDIRALQMVVAQQESDIQSLKGAAIAPSIQLDLAKQELRELQENIIMAQTKYEEEFSQRLTLQDQVQKLTHHMEDIKQIHMKETQELRAQIAQSQALVLQLEDELRSVSRGGPALVEAVQRIQEASEAEVKRLHSETESAYNQNLLELQMRLNNDQILLGQAQEDNQHLYQRVEELTSEVTVLEKKLFEKGTNSRTLMEKLEVENMKGLQHIRALEARLEEMQDLLLAKMKELNTFQESNVSLRSELDALKSMLEEEEHQMSSNNWHLPQTPSSSSIPLTESFQSSIHIPEYHTTTEVLPSITTSYSSEPSTSTLTEESFLKGENNVEDTQDHIDQLGRSASAPLLNSQTPDLSKSQGSLCSENVNPKCIRKTPPLTSKKKTAVSRIRKSQEKKLVAPEAVSPVHTPEQQKQDGEPITERDTQSPEFLPAHHSRLEKVPSLLKREKISSAVLQVTSSPWTQSTASPTHPDFTPSRFVPLGSDGNSQCRQTRLAGKGTLRLLLPGSFAPPSAQHQAGLQILQSVQNLDFQPPMPKPPSPTSW
ncbi:vimentin-like [Pyxicephalus adspersus]|uniref:vimentin-like n=1 Tax=Pyxicephalus adspersus TaxID=30357 RepID=UPI003B5CA18F